MTNSITKEDIKEFLLSIEYDTEFIGEMNFVIGSFCTLNTLKNNSITWIKHVSEDNLEKLKGISHCIVVLDKYVPVNIETVCYIVTSAPKAVFFSILKHFWCKKSIFEIEPTATVKTNDIEGEISVGCNCYIGADVTIGSGTVIEHNVCIYNRVRIGRNCIIHSGTVIGADGFGYYIDLDGKPKKVEHFGGVYIGDNVEVGANVCIDRGTIEDTQIQANVKIDNLVHIAHNVIIGESSMIVAGAIICGSSKIGNNSYVAPGGIVKNQITLKEGAYVGMGAVVTKSVSENTVVVGVPARPLRTVSRDQI